MSGMTYLLRILLPDRPGSLGAVATAMGAAGADIVSLDVVERGPDGAVDDLLVALPPGGLADTLVSAALSVPGVVVESLRPYLGGAELHRDLELVDEMSARPTAALRVLAESSPGVFRAGWAVLVEGRPGALPRVAHTSAGAPEIRVPLPWLPLASPRTFDASESWLPERWSRLGTELAAAPVGSPDLVVLVGRPGGPQFRSSELLRLAHLAGIAGTVGELQRVRSAG